VTRVQPGPGPPAPPAPGENDDADGAGGTGPGVPAARGGAVPGPSAPPAAGGGGQASAQAAQLVSEIKTYLARHQGSLGGLVADHDPALSGEALGERNARAADGLLRSLFAAASSQVWGTRRRRPAVVLAAVGSYGRGAVALKSDLDVRFLSAGPPDEVAALAEAMLYPLWDGGLSVGHQIVSPEELIELARTDLPTATSLLDWRHIAGEEQLSSSLVSRARKALFDGSAGAAFVARLVDETAARHERYGGSVYLLEPDVKNGAGGLRDLDVALWVCRARWGERSLGDLVGRGVLLEREAAQIAHARELLWRIRNRLHLAANRRADRLTFDLQERVAVALGYLAPATRRLASQPHGALGVAAGADGADGADALHEAACSAAVEAFMSDYYRNARAIARVREVLVNRARPLPRARREQPVEGGFRLVDGQLTLADESALEADPSLALRLVAEAIARQVGVEPFAREAVCRAAEDPSFAARLRASREAARLFVLLCTSAAETRFLGRSVLEELHDLGLLVAMIPEFSPAVGRVHHDVYHVYTVDVHSVAAVDRLRALVRGDLTAEHPLACRLAAEISQPEVLYLATLLHDVGKAIGGTGHAARGAEMALAIGQRLGLPAGHTDQVAHLVRTHLDMYHVATGRDLDDPAALDAFLASVWGRENLRELYLLTVADLSTTSPTAMTSWKAKLLDELYLSAEARLLGQARHGLDEVRVEQAAREALALSGGTAPAQAFIGSMSDRYLLSNLPQAIAAHSAVAERAAASGAALSLTAAGHAGVAELCVAATDRPGLLASIAAAIVACGLEVQAAQIHSRPLPDGTIQAVDLFWVKGRLPDARAAASVARHLEKALGAFLRSERPVSSALAARGSSPWASRHSPPVQTAISVDDRASPTHGILEVVTRDRPGVLCALALALHELGLSIALAKINTEGTRVADVFYLTDGLGQKRDLLPIAAQLRQKIVAALGLLTPRQGTHRS
jgi:[protein-PII] uridylyltransferase